MWLRYKCLILHNHRQCTMATILNIETSTNACSTAISENGEVSVHFEDFEPRTNANKLGTFVNESIEALSKQNKKLDAVAVSCGPGSYTGLRVGVSMAKGICFGKGIPLIAIPTLEVLCVIPLLYHELEDNALLCPMIDARRMEVYTSLYDRSLKQLMPTSAIVINENSFHEELEKNPIYFFGNGADKIKQTVKHTNAKFIDGMKPLAKAMSILSEKAYMANDFKDTAYFEPFYLKDFVATTPKKLL